MDALAPKSESLFQVAWAQFRRHRLAVWGGRILLVLYFVAAFAGFFSPYDPNYYELYPPKGHHPPTRIHFVDPETGRLSRPFVYATRRTIDPVSLQPRYEEDPSQGKFYIRFFVRTPDQPYTIFRVFRADLRLFGVDPPGRIFLMGTDNFGRDLFSRLVYGAQVSLTIGISSLGGSRGFTPGGPLSSPFPFGPGGGGGSCLVPFPGSFGAGLRRGPCTSPGPTSASQGSASSRPWPSLPPFGLRASSSSPCPLGPSKWTWTTSSCGSWR